MLMASAYSSAMDRVSSPDIQCLWSRVVANKARISTTVKKPEGQLKMNYRLRRDAATQPWKVTDVVVSGISVVSMYRVTFASIVAS